MLNKFNEHTDENVKDSKIECTIICFDSNVWLDLYSLPPVFIEEFIKVVSDNIGRFWLPNQVYIEFNRNFKRNREDAINRYKDLITESCNQLSHVKNKIGQEFTNLKKDKIVDAHILSQEFRKEIGELQRKLKEQLKCLDVEYQKKVECISEKSDIIVDLIEKLHKQRVEDKFSAFELIDIYEEGERRYKYDIPPGYTDKNKPEKKEDKNIFLMRKYGDLVIWKEILSKMKTSDKNILFVQNEKKKDWWERGENKRINPLLLEEYKKNTNDKTNIKMVNFLDFLSLHGLNIGLKAESIEEIEEISKLSEFKNSVYDYIKSEKASIIYDYVQKEYTEEGKLYSLLMDYSLFGGTVSELEDVEILNINIIESNIIDDEDDEWIDNEMTFSIEVEFEAMASSYINKYVYHGGQIQVKYKLDLSITFTINYDDLLIEPQNAYSINNLDFFNEDLIELDDRDYDIDIAYEDDSWKYE